ncbi:polyprenyl synthetase family protein [Streptomyces noursei]
MTIVKSTPVVTEALDMAALRRVTDEILDSFLIDRARAAAKQSLPGEVTQVLRQFVLSGGKRIRPVLCAAGWHAAGGKRLPGAVARVAASLEMFHAFALIHDDVMDASDQRRGRPTVHRVFAERHRNGRDDVAGDRIGVSAAVLAGDLALAWSDQLLHTAGLTPGQLATVLTQVDEMRTELMYGQYLDVTSTGRPTEDVEQALRIVRYKTARYTVRWPMLIGATLAGGQRPVCDALDAYALPVGEIFQLRDDVLSVFGCSGQTGKSRSDDLRDGKHTLPAAFALQRADSSQRHLLHLLLGCPQLDMAGAAEIRRIFEATGARQTVEELIQDRRRQALKATEVGLFPPAVAATLRHLIQSIADRTS